MNHIKLTTITATNNFPYTNSNNDDRTGSRTVARLADAHSL
jgi:hypothetical protein